MASTAGAFDNILMNGQEVFKFAVRAVPTVRAPPQRCHDQQLISGMSHTACQDVQICCPCFACRGIAQGCLLPSASSGLVAACQRVEIVRGVLQAELLPTYIEASSCSSRTLQGINRCSAQVVEAALADADLAVTDIDWLLLHQANQVLTCLPAPHAFKALCFCNTSCPPATA